MTIVIVYLVYTKIFFGGGGIKTSVIWFFLGSWYLISVYTKNNIVKNEKEKNMEKIIWNLKVLFWLLDC